ncbi:hypothetical protein SDC9_200288 [bioreactor metagenome]|uniref:Uncharacterized protein n=1 Tax=bioreactor metagenome TaxID=1076179 RepID=A0A645INI3_9ZZZZ
MVRRYIIICTVQNVAVNMLLIKTGDWKNGLIL